SPPPHRPSPSTRPATSRSTSSRCCPTRRARRSPRRCRLARTTPSAPPARPASPNTPFGASPPAGGGGAAMLGGARSTVGSSLCPDDPALTWPLITQADHAVAGDTRTVRIDPTNLVTAFTRDV